MSGGDHLSGFYPLVIAVIGAVVLGIVLLYFLAQWLSGTLDISKWITFTVALLIALSGTAATIWYVFGQQSSEVHLRITVPRYTDGIAYLIFDSRLPPLPSPTDDGTITLRMDSGGAVWAGSHYRDFDRLAAFQSVDFVYDDGAFVLSEPSDMWTHLQHQGVRMDALPYSVGTAEGNQRRREQLFQLPNSAAAEQDLRRLYKARGLSYPEP